MRAYRYFQMISLLSTLEMTNVCTLCVYKPFEFKVLPTLPICILIPYSRKFLKGIIFGYYEIFWI